MERVSIDSRRLDGTDNQGEKFVHMLFIYFCICTFLLGMFAAMNMVVKIRKRQAREAGKEISSHIHKMTIVRRPAAMAYLLFVCVPTVILFVCFTLGALLAVIEDWGVLVGAEYVLTNVLGLSTPLTKVSPDSSIGKIADVVISLWAMLLATTAMGLAAGMSMVGSIIDRMPTSASGFFLYVGLYIPVSLVLIAILTGLIMASIEDWNFSDGFFFMAGSICGLANPLTEVRPDSATGAFFEVLCISVELCLGGAIIGVVGAHPLSAQIINWLEGGAAEEEHQDEGQPEKTIVPEQSAKLDEQAATSENVNSDQIPKEKNPRLPTEDQTPENVIPRTGTLTPRLSPSIEVMLKIRDRLRLELESVEEQLQQLDGAGSTI